MKTQEIHIKEFTGADSINYSETITVPDIGNMDAAIHNFLLNEWREDNEVTYQDGIYYSEAGEVCWKLVT